MNYQPSLERNLDIVSTQDWFPWLSKFESTSKTSIANRWPCTHYTLTSSYMTLQLLRRILSQSAFGLMKTRIAYVGKAIAKVQCDRVGHVCNRKDGRIKLRELEVKSLCPAVGHSCRLNIVWTFWIKTEKAPWDSVLSSVTKSLKYSNNCST